MIMRHKAGSRAPCHAGEMTHDHERPALQAKLSEVSAQLCVHTSDKPTGTLTATRASDKPPRTPGATAQPVSTCSARLNLLSPFAQTCSARLSPLSPPQPAATSSLVRVPLTRRGMPRMLASCKACGNSSAGTDW